MTRKSKVEVDEALMRKMIAGEVPLSTNVMREVQETERKTEDRVNTAAREITHLPTTALDARRRRMAAIPDFEQTFMTLMEIRQRAALYVSIGTKRKILEVVKKIGGEYMTATSYVENILRQHLELYKDDINRIHKEQNTKELL